MIGKSDEIKTTIAWGQSDLNKWLRENDVTILDIKFAVSTSSSDKFLIIYKD